MCNEDGVLCNANVSRRMSSSASKKIWKKNLRWLLIKSKVIFPCGVVLNLPEITVSNNQITHSSGRTPWIYVNVL